MLYTDTESLDCPVWSDPGNYHFEGRCENCDARRMAQATLGQVEEWYQAGRITQDQFEAFMYVWATGAPRFGSYVEWDDVPAFPDVRRIARKIIKAGGREVPPELVG